MLVSGRRESLISSTMSVRVSNAGSMRVNFIMCPGNHDGGTGNAGMGICERTISISSSLSRPILVQSEIPDTAVE